MAYMLRFAEAFPDETILHTLCAKLRWSHYLRWLDKQERREGEDRPLGMIFCAGKKQEQIELLELGSSGIHVAEYLTDLLPKEVLQEKLHKAITLARERLESVGEKRIAENVVKLLEGE